MTPCKMTSEQLVQVYAHADRLLLEATKDYENLVSAVCQYREASTDADLAYEKAFADAVERLKTGDEKVTIVKELARRECFDLYAMKCHAEDHYKRCQNLAEAKIERINSLKKILETKRN